MNMVATLARNRATSIAVADHLRACDDSFVPALGTRVVIDEYASKIVARAERFEAWDSDRLVGLLAAYCNDPAHQTAFITSVSVLPPWLGQGIASRLLRACVEQVREGQFKHIDLEVDSRNSPAALLYQKHGFAVASARDHTLTLRLAV